MTREAAQEQTAAHPLGDLVAEHPIGAAGPALLVLGVALLLATAFLAYEWQNMPRGGHAAQP